MIVLQPSTSLFRLGAAGLVLGGLAVLAAAAGEPAAGTVAILELGGRPADPAAIDYAGLPRLSGKHAVVNSVAPGPHARPPSEIDMHDLRLNLHNYLAHHDGRFWCIWSDGPQVEDQPTQEVRYSTSLDGQTWTPAQSVTGTPPEPRAYIARGLWVRDGELLALAAHFRGKGAFGTQSAKQLELVAFAWDSAAGTWKPRGRVYDNCINNFPPQKLDSGDWAMTRRDSRFNVSLLVGGRTTLDDWTDHPVVAVGGVPGFRPDEPIFWQQPDKTLTALFRDNGGSRRLFHATSRDGGRTWDDPAKTNVPNASSKLYSLRTSRGYRILILNAHPAVNRRELYLALSADGRTFTRLAKLEIPSPPSIPQDVARIKRKFQSGIASLQYPHAIEHDGSLLIALSRGKVQTEVFQVALDDVHALLERGTR